MKNNSFLAKTYSWDIPITTGLTALKFVEISSGNECYSWILTLWEKIAAIVTTRKRSFTPAKTAEINQVKEISIRPSLMSGDEVARAMPLWDQVWLPAIRGPLTAYEWWIYASEWHHCHWRLAKGTGCVCRWQLPRPNGEMPVFRCIWKLYNGCGRGSFRPSMDRNKADDENHFELSAR